MSGEQRRIVTHYAKTSMGDALCGMNYPRTHGITAWKTDTTCPRCLALLAALGGEPEADAAHGAAAASVHALTPIDMARARLGIRPGPLCGQAGPTALSARHVTCPQCRALPVSIRTGVERGESDLRGVVLGLSVWEGRGDWAAWPAAARQKSAARALAQLGEVVESLTDWRAVLAAALGGN